MRGVAEGGAAFDGVAPTYDSGFTERRLGRWLRARVQQEAAPFLAPGSRVLELACGTGEDALWLARRGCHVLATDASQGMLSVARHKARAAGLADAIAFEPLDLNALPASGGPWLARSERFDGVFSNFGGLNCVRERVALAGWLAARLPRGARVILVVMGPVALWEMGWHLLHGEPRRGLRRLRGGGLARVGGGGVVPVWYPSPLRLQREFAPAFRAVHRCGIGALLPPSYLDHLVERWPRAFSQLDRAEQALGRLVPWSWVADHYLIVLERR